MRAGPQAHPAPAGAAGAFGAGPNLEPRAGAAAHAQTTPVVFVVGTLLACTVLQRFALPLGGFKIHAATVVCLGLALWYLFAGTLALDRRRSALLLALFGMGLVATAAQMNMPVAIAPNSSLPSLAYWLLVTAFAALSFARPVPELWFFRLVNAVLAGIAVAGLLQFLAQFIGLALFSFSEFLPGQILVEDLFAVRVAFGGGLRANGLFLVEPSVFSQFMAVALMVETLCFRRPAYLALFFAALLSAVSGTGLLVLAVFAAQIGLGYGLRGIAAALGLALGGVLALAAMSVWLPEIAEVLMARTGELALPGTSGHERFVTPFLVLDDVLAVAPRALLTGLGPGAVEGVSVPYVYHVNTPVKLVVEYGVPGLVLYLALLLSARRTPRQRTLVLPMLVLLMFTGGYQQFAPVAFLVFLIITVARLEEDRPGSREAVPLASRGAPTSRARTSGAARGMRA